MSCLQKAYHSCHYYEIVLSLFLIPYSYRTSHSRRRCERWWPISFYLGNLKGPPPPPKPPLAPTVRVWSALPSFVNRCHNTCLPIRLIYVYTLNCSFQPSK